MQNERYQKIYIRSKNELAKHLSHKKFSKDEALNLINDVMRNFNQYWKHNEVMSEPEKEKYVRNAKGTPLGKLLDKINTQVLAPHDSILPCFIFGGVKEKNHVQASQHLLGTKRLRVALKMDITHFFEQVTSERVYNFFLHKCGCDKRASKILTNLCCVTVGPKDSNLEKKTIARGFATSSRLAVWCNLDTFIKLERLVQKRLKGKDPRVAIYVDDIGVTASRVSKEEMEKLATEIEELLLHTDKNQPLPVNAKKTKVTSHDEGIEHLGLKLNKNTLSLGKKSWSKRDQMKSYLKKDLSVQEKTSIRTKYRAMSQYKRYVES